MTPPSTADMWALAQAVCFAFGFVLNERAAERYPNLITSTTALQLVAVSVLTGVWATLDVSFAAGVPSLPHISAAFTAPSAAVAVLYAGIVTTALTVWLENIALARVSAQEMAVLLSTEPLWAAGFASILLGEHMGGQAVCGGMVILVACVMNQMRGDVGGKVGSKLRGWGKKAGVGSLLMSLQVLGIWK